MRAHQTQLAAMLAAAILIGFCGETMGQANRESPGRQGASGSGNVDTQASRVYVLVGKEGFGHEHGVEGVLKEGTIQLGADSGAGTLVFDMASFESDTKAARKYVKLEAEFDQDIKEINATMKGEKILNVEKYPTATFEIESAQKVDSQEGESGTAYELKGTFTLHDTEKPLTVVAKATEKDGKTRLTGSFKIKQTDFGIEPYSAALGLAKVADELVIYGDLLIAADAGTERTAPRTTRDRPNRQ